MHRVVTKLAAALIGVSACLSWLSAQQPGAAVPPGRRAPDHRQSRGADRALGHPRRERPVRPRRARRRDSAASRRDARRRQRQDHHAGAHRHPQPHRLDRSADQRRDHHQLLAGDGRRPPAPLCVFRLFRGHEPGPRPLERRSRDAVQAARRGHSQRRSLSHRRPWDCCHAHGRPSCRLPPGGSLRRRHRGGGTRAGTRAQGEERRHDQDLGRRSPGEGAEAGGQRLRSDHRRSPQERHARRQPYLQPGRRQAAAEVRRRRLRTRRPRQGHRRRVPDDPQAAPEGLDRTEPARTPALRRGGLGADRLDFGRLAAEPGETASRPARQSQRGRRRAAGVVATCSASSAAI